MNIEQAVMAIIKYKYPLKSRYKVAADLGIHVEELDVLVEKKKRSLRSPAFRDVTDMKLMNRLKKCMSQPDYVENDYTKMIKSILKDWAFFKNITPNQRRVVELHVRRYE